MFRFTFTLFVGIIFSFNNDVASLSMDSYKKEFVQQILECTKDHSVTQEDVIKIKEKQVLEQDNVKCLFACAFKKAGMMDDQGMLSIVGMHDLGRRFFSEDPEKLKKSEDFLEACKHVNDAAISDGAKGCDRAALIFRCSIEKSPQFAISV